MLAPSAEEEKKADEGKVKGQDHALHRLGSGREFASASSPHLASSITNISTGLCSLSLSLSLIPPRPLSPPRFT